MSRINDERLYLRWGIRFKGVLIGVFRSKKRAEMILELGKRDTPNSDTLVLEDLGRWVAPLEPKP